MINCEAKLYKSMAEALADNKVLPAIAEVVRHL